jgi:phosphoribosyl 1,2-cyclic phosphodiesterase
LRVCLLASGSKGNALYIESGESRLLIDAGLSARELTTRLDRIGVAGEHLNGLLVTHEHSDHCRGLGPMARRFGLPVHIHHDTHAALPRVGNIPGLRMFETGEVLAFRDMKVETFPITHDAAAPVGFTIETGEGKIGVATDLGIATRLVGQHLKGCRVLVLESNHDEGMLQNGPYPWHLKQRIRSNHGHLSNHASSELLEGLLWEGLEAVFLAHLSETNNHPSLAESCALEMLAGQNVCRPEVILGCQHRPSLCFSF